jgi:hypothetical protein
MPLFTLPVTAEDSTTTTITVTMTTKSVLQIELNPINWEIGAVEPNTEYKTNPEKTWCAMTNRGNCLVDTFIKGTDPQWKIDPDEKWTLSSDGQNGADKCALWYWMAWESTEFVPITKADTGMGTEFYRGLDIGADNQKQFGLKLLTPSAFVGSRDMESSIIISAVVA